jgi:hypothetical protein
LKAWQIFLFTMIPLALVFAGVIAASFHGSDSRLEEFNAPTPAPQASPRALTDGVQPPSRLVSLTTAAAESQPGMLIDCLPEEKPQARQPEEGAPPAPSPGS